MTRPRTRHLRYLLPLLLLAAAAAFWHPGNGNRGLSLDYTVRPVPGRGFDVEVHATGLRGARHGFRLLDGWGLLQDQSGHVEDLAATGPDGRPIDVTPEIGSGTARWHLAGKASEAVVRYHVRSYPPDVSAEASYVDRSRLVMLGYSLFLLPLRIDHYAPLDVTVRVDSSAVSPLWSSWPEVDGAYRPGSAHDLWSGVVAGGDFAPVRLARGPVSVTVLTETPAAAGTGLTIANRLLPVLGRMVDLFGAPPRGDSLSVLAVYRTRPPPPGRSVMSGNSEEGAFLCVASPDRFADPQSLTQLASHECLHFYLGGALTGGPEPPYQNSPDLIWLVEGVTEYLSYRFMVEAGVMSHPGFREVVLRKERKASEAPSNVTLAAAARHMNRMDTYQLVYSRGFLVGLLLDREMGTRCGPDALNRALRRLFDERNFYRTGDALTPDYVRRVFDSACPGTAGLIARYAEGDAPLPELSKETDLAGSPAEVGIAGANR
jgi:predicted metalloprotease with PDZ domain